MKVIYPMVACKVPQPLHDAIAKAYAARKPHNPKLRRVDIWLELVKKVKQNES